MPRQAFVLVLQLCTACPQVRGNGPATKRERGAPHASTCAWYWRPKPNTAPLSL